MNTSSTTFDEDKSKQIAFNVNDNQKDGQAENYFPNHLMNKQLLNSERLTSTGFQFALGYLRQDLNEIKLLPIRSVLDFKPAFHYLDKIKVKTSNKNQDDSDEEDEHEQLNAKEEAATTKKVTMRFEDKKKSDAKQQQANEQKDKLVNENWINVQYFDYGLPKFEKEKDMVLYKVSQEAEADELDSNGTIVNNNIDKNEKKQKFSYQEFARNLELKINETLVADDLKIDLLNTLPFYQTSQLSLKDQIRSILCSSKVISFNKCMHLLQLNVNKNRLIDSNCSELDVQLVIRFLQQYAQLVQGNWVVKSDVIYPKNFKASSHFDPNSIPFTNISTEMLCKARDYVLFKFTKEESLSRLELIEQVKIPPSVIGEILSQFSFFNKETRSWHFIYSKDEKFIANHKAIVDNQAQIWDAQSNRLNNLFG